MARCRWFRSKHAGAIGVLWWALAGCTTPSNAGANNQTGSDARPDRTSGGSGGGGDAQGDGGSSCSVTPSGCFCIAGTDLGGLTSCDSASVVKDGAERGFCCADTGTDSPLCRCDAYVCKNNPTAQDCECGTAFSVAMDVPTGTTATDCPAPTASQKCCFSAETATCICSTLDCESAVAVPDCSVTRVAACPSGQQSVTACK